MAGKFELKVSSNGKYHFNLKAGNGQIILSSEMYESKSAAENGIDPSEARALLPEVDQALAQLQAMRNRLQNEVDGLRPVKPAAVIHFGHQA